MPITQQAENLRIVFIDTLRAQGLRVDDMSSFALIFDDKKTKEIFQRWYNLGREIFFIEKVGFINAHVRSDPPGFWGISQHIIDDFEIIKALGIKCWFILLIDNHNNSDSSGYIVENVCSSPMIKTPSRQANGFKINEGDLDKSKLLHSSEALAKSLIDRCKIKSTVTIIRRHKV